MENWIYREVARCGLQALRAKRTIGISLPVLISSVPTQPAFSPDKALETTTSRATRIRKRRCAGQPCTDFGGRSRTHMNRDRPLSVLGWIERNVAVVRVIGMKMDQRFDAIHRPLPPLTIPETSRSSLQYKHAPRDAVSTLYPAQPRSSSRDFWSDSGNNRGPAMSAYSG